MDCVKHRVGAKQGQGKETFAGDAIAIVVIFETNESLGHVRFLYTYIIHLYINHNL